jgi:hypothetical protein
LFRCHQRSFSTMHSRVRGEKTSRTLGSQAGRCRSSLQTPPHRRSLASETNSLQTPPRMVQPRSLLAEPRRCWTAHDDLVVLKLRHMQPFHIGSACRIRYACSRLCFARSRLAMVLAVVNDYLQTIPKLL